MWLPKRDMQSCYPYSCQHQQIKSSQREMHLPSSSMLHPMYTTYLQGIWTMFEAWNLVDGKEALLLFAPGFRKWNRFCDLLCKIMIYVLSKRDRECDSEWEGQEGKAIESGAGAILGNKIWRKTNMTMTIVTADFPSSDCAELFFTVHCSPIGRCCLYRAYRSV